VGAKAEAKVYVTAKDMTGPGLKKAGTSMRNFGRKMSMFVTAPLAILGGIALKTAADFEKQQVAFETMLGSAEKAKVLLKDIIDFSAKTPFKLPGLQDATKRLLGFGIEADRVVSTLRNLGNVAQGDQARLDRLTLAFGKLRAKGKATLEELNMFLEAGVPILDELSSMYNVTTQEMFEMISEGKIGFNDVNKALINLSTGTGKFAGMLAKQSQTLSGLFSTILDNLKLLGMEIMQTILPQIKEFANKALKLIQKLREMDDRTKKIIITIAALTAVIGPLMIAIGSFVAMLNFLAAAGGPIMWVIAAIGLLVTAGVLLYTHWEKVSRFLERLWVNLSTFAQQIFHAMKIAVMQPIIDILNGLRWVRELFGGEATKIREAIRKLNDEQVKSAVTMKELGDRRREANEAARALRIEEKKLKEAQAAMNEVLITAPPLVEDYTFELEKLNEEIELGYMHSQMINNELMHSADNMLFAATQTNIYVEAMRRLEDRARSMKQPLAELTNPMNELTEKIREAEDQLRNTEQFVREHWAPTWELMGNAALSAEAKVKEAFKNIFVDVLRMLSRYLFELGTAHLIPGLMFNPAAGIGYLAASAATSMAAGFIQSLGQGGIVTQPTLALVGESGPEAVVPLNKSGGIGTTINVYIAGSVKTEKDIAVTIAEEMQRQGYIA